ncbi:YbaK/EbsC family protein [uncultured Clostridium sp.]|uniref:YbaK/EbsC family protein n=1 Tax=uncultured Clostridium sp. TaxID=59620 RepID=UPI003216A26D
MSIENVRKYLSQWNLDSKILEFDVSSATVELAALAIDVIPARIAKTLSFKSDKGCILVVTAGDGKIDNSKFKAQFKMKAKMLSPDEVIQLTGHSIGGVCPFGIENPNVKIYTDISLKRFNTVFPACGSSNSAIELSCDDLYKYSKSLEWIDVCKGWEE